MNLLINLLPIKKGGGQQVATNFITQIVSQKNIKPYFLVTEDTIVHSLLKSLNYSKVIVVRNSVFERFLFQNFKLGKHIKQNRIKLIYTMFGPGLHHKGIPSVTGCAYSNLFFPEIDFWNGYSAIQQTKFKLIDKYRLKSTLKSDAIVFENEAMQKRAVKLFNYPEEKTIFIPPSITEYKDSMPSADFKARLQKIYPTKFNILILSGWHKNKNIEQVPFILKKLFEKNCDDVQFVITVPPDHPSSVALIEKAKEFGVENNIMLFNSVKPDEVYSLFQYIDAVILLSLLESFSNNIIEAWYFNKPLFISNQEWARAICKDAAIYVDRENPENIANQIIDYRNHMEKQMLLTNSSMKILKSYPSPKEKVDLQIKFLETIYNKFQNEKSH